MERIKQLQCTLPAPLRGELNLIFLNALAEFHNCSHALGFDFLKMTPAERTAQMRRLGGLLLGPLRLQQTASAPSAAATLQKSSVFPNIIALELIDQVQKMRETAAGRQIETITLFGISENFEEILEKIVRFYPEISFQTGPREKARTI